MDPIRIQVDVNIGERTEAFLTKLLAGVFSASQAGPAVDAVQVNKEAKTEEPKKQEAPKVAPPKKPVTSAPSAPAPSATETSGDKVDIKDIRKVLASKVNEHRETIKAKLNEYGVANVTTLPEEKYTEFYAFLEKL